MKLSLLTLTSSSCALLAVACSATLTATPRDSTDAGSDAGIDGSHPQPQPEAGPDVTSPDGAAPDAADAGADADDGAVACVPDGSVPDLGSASACTTSERSAHWGKMVAAPIALNPVRAALLDLSGASALDGGAATDAGAGLTIDQAAAVDCTANAIGGDCLTYSATWGETQEVTTQFYLADRKVFYLGLGLGYVGTLPFTNGADSYVIQVFQRIKKNGAYLTFDWSDTAGMTATADAIYRGLAATYFPSITPGAADCVATGDCKIDHFTDGSGYVFYPKLGFAFRVASITAAQPTPSTVSFLDLYQL